MVSLILLLYDKYIKKTTYGFIKRENEGKEYEKI